MVWYAVVIRSGGQENLATMVDMAYTTLVHIPYPLLSHPCVQDHHGAWSKTKKSVGTKGEGRCRGAMVIGKATLIVRYTLVTDSFFVE